MFTWKKIFDLCEDDKFKDIFAYIIDSDIKTNAKHVSHLRILAHANVMNADWPTQTAFFRAKIIREKV